MIAILVRARAQQCMALMLRAAAQAARVAAHMQVVRIVAGCEQQGQRLDKTATREFSFTHAFYVRTAAPFGAILRASPQVLNFRGFCTDQRGDD